jgi:hypothetical protein
VASFPPGVTRSRCNVTSTVATTDAYSASGGRRCRKVAGPSAHNPGDRKAKVKQMRPSQAEYFAYFDRYVSLVPEGDVLPALGKQMSAVQAACATLSEDRAGFRYAPGKWSVRQVLGHIIDTERVFGYRALCIARGEAVSLPSFDENEYAAAAGHDRCPLPELVEEFSALRQSHIHMLRHLDDAAWKRVGRVNEHPTSARAMAYIMAGHVRHHATVLSERYGIEIVA